MRSRCGQPILAMLATALSAALGGCGGETTAPSPLSITRGGGILHTGSYCQSLQPVGQGEGVQPVVGGCQFDLTQPADLFGTDSTHYSVSKVVGSAELGVRGDPGATVIVVCRLDPRQVYWFWIASDGGWNIDDAADVHHPVHLVSAATVAAKRPYVVTNGQRNRVQFRCQGGMDGQPVNLAMNVNEQQFAALSVPPSSATPAKPLTSPNTPWFVDIGARLTNPGTLEGVVARLTLYDSE